MDIGITTSRLNEAFLYLKSRGLVSTQKEIGSAVGSDPSNISRAFKGDGRYLTNRFLIRFNHAFGDIFNPEWLEGKDGEPMLRDKMDVVVMPCYYNEEKRMFHANGDDWPSRQAGWYKICDASYVKWKTFRAAIYDMVISERYDASNQMIRELWIDYNYSYNNGEEADWQPPESITKNFMATDIKGRPFNQKGTIEVEENADGTSITTCALSNVNNMFDLKSFRKEVGLSQSELANILGCGQPNISSMERTNRNLEREHEDILIERFGKEIVDKFKLEQSESTGKRVYRPIPKGNEGYRMVPLINIDSVGGIHSDNMITTSEQYVIRMMPFTEAIEGDVAILQSGNSMYPTIPSGSALLLREVENWREYFGYGNVYVLLLKDGRRITKEVRKYEDDPKNYVWCVSYNPDVADEELPRSMIRGVWKVIKYITDFGW